MLSPTKGDRKEEALMFEVSIIVGDMIRGRLFDTEEEAYSFCDTTVDLIEFVGGTAKLMIRDLEFDEIIDFVDANLDTEE